MSLLDAAFVHARWHRALGDPSLEADNPIGDHIRSVLAEAWDKGWNDCLLYGDAVSGPPEEQPGFGENPYRKKETTR